MSNIRIYAASDTHTLHRKIQIPECDIFLHAGDITDRGEEKTIWDFMDWLREIPAKHKVFIAGNHDFCFQKNRAVVGSSLVDGIHYLEHNMVMIEGIKIFGTPWTPYFYDWAFNGTDKEEGDGYGPNLNRLFGQIPDDIDILLTHGPSAHILSTNERGEECGSNMLHDHLVRIKPKVHIHGHIHESYGHTEIDWGNNRVTNVYNVSSLHRDYITSRPATRIEL